MSKQEEAGLILKLYELRREETMRKARDWYFREFNPQTMADFTSAIFGEHSGHLFCIRITCCSCRLVLAADADADYGCIRRDCDRSFAGHRD